MSIVHMGSATMRRVPIGWEVCCPLHGEILFAGEGAAAKDLNVHAVCKAPFVPPSAPPPKRRTRTLEFQS